MSTSSSPSSSYVPSPTFSERVKRTRHSTENRIPANPGTAESDVHLQPKKKHPQLPAFPDAVRAHRLPLVLKSSRGDSLQVYLVSYARKDPEVGITYDVEFDDGTLKKNVPRYSLSAPPETSYQLMRLQDSQESLARTPVRRKTGR